jgi:chemotaxis protein CheC
MADGLLRDEALRKLLELMAQRGVENAAVGLSEMIGQCVRVKLPSISIVPISSVAERVGGAEAPVVGIYLAAEGELCGHVMLIMQHAEALRLVDLLYGQPEGQTKELDSLARSALAEAGNITASFFLNAVASSLGLSGRPSPPAVIVDMAGAILDIMLVTAGQLCDDILMLQTVFDGEDREIHIHFWMVPDLVQLSSALNHSDSLLRG